MQSFIGLWSMESAKRKCWKFKLCITESKKSLNITQKSVPTTVTTNERTIISETKYFLPQNLISLKNEANTLLITRIAL